MTHVPESLRRAVIERAEGKCEYCLLDERHALKKHEVDHIRAEKHGGATTYENLCLSCFECNRYKGSDLSSVDPVTDNITPLFNPRHDDWKAHFTLLPNGRVEGKTPKGRATILLLEFNHPERITLRSVLIEIGEMLAE